jgi:hypothetical protein
VFYKNKFKLISEDLKSLLDWSLADQAKSKDMSDEICALNQLNDRLTNRLFLLEEKVTALSFKEATPDPVYLSKINGNPLMGLVPDLYSFIDKASTENGSE